MIFLQKMARGSLARKQYQRMLAARAIWGKYRKYKMRSYVNTLQKTFRWIQLDNVITIALCICASIVLMIQWKAIFIHIILYSYSYQVIKKPLTHMIVVIVMGIGIAM